MKAAFEKLNELEHKTPHQQYRNEENRKTNDWWRPNSGHNPNEKLSQYPKKQQQQQQRQQIEWRKMRESEEMKREREGETEEEWECCMEKYTKSIRNVFQIEAKRLFWTTVQINQSTNGNGKRIKRYN